MMAEYTKLEFNKAMAAMAGIAVILSGTYGEPLFYELDVEREEWDNSMKLYDPYNDANQLLPLTQHFGDLKDSNRFIRLDDYEQFKINLRDALWKRAKELGLAKSAASAEAEHVQQVMILADKITYACTKGIQDEYVQQMMQLCRDYDDGDI